MSGRCEEQDGVVLTPKVGRLHVVLPEYVVPPEPVVPPELVVLPERAVTMKRIVEVERRACHHLD